MQWEFQDQEEGGGTIFRILIRMAQAAFAPPHAPSSLKFKSDSWSCAYQKPFWGIIVPVRPTRSVRDCRQTRYTQRPSSQRAANQRHEATALQRIALHLPPQSRTLWHHTGLVRIKSGARCSARFWPGLGPLNHKRYYNVVKLSKRPTRNDA